MELKNIVAHLTACPGQTTSFRGGQVTWRHPYVMLAVVYKGRVQVSRARMAPDALVGLVGLTTFTSGRRVLDIVGEPVSVVVLVAARGDRVHKVAHLLFEVGELEVLERGGPGRVGLVGVGGGDRGRGVAVAARVDGQGELHLVAC
jgi:hypothetical protein